jgi:hypothetical protein
MHIEYRINERDFRSAATLANRKRSNLSALEHFWPYIFCLVWIMIGWLPGGGNLDPSNSDDLYFELGGLPIFLVLLYMRRVQLKREYVKASNFRLLHALDLDANGLRLVTSVGTSRSSWELYEKYAENDDVFILYELGKHTFMPISKSHLVPLQTDELRTLLNAYLKRA